MYTKEQLKDLFHKLEEILDAAPEDVADRLEQLMDVDEKPTPDWEKYELDENDEKLINQFGNRNFNYNKSDDSETSAWKSLVVRLLLNILRRVNITTDEILTRQEADRHEIKDHIDAAKKEILDEIEKRSIIQPVIVSYPEPEKKDVSPLDPYVPQPWTTPNTPYPYTPSVPWPNPVWYRPEYTVTCKVGQAYDSPYGATGC